MDAQYPFRTILPAVPRRLTFSRGFSLVEMAVVLVIVALFIAGMMLPLSAQQDIRARQETEKALANIRDTLFGFAVTTGRLPCPADPTIVSGSAGAGTENCALTQGVIPWATLGLPETDAWGRRFTYRVTDSFKDAIAANTLTPPATCTPSSPPTQASFALCSEGDIAVTDGGTAIASNVPAAIVSHGTNGQGGYLPNGTQLPGAAGNELENADINTTFVSRTPDPAFDDVVVWLSPNLLYNRMISAGKLP